MSVSLQHVRLARMADPLQTFGFGQWTMAAVRFLCYGSSVPVAITARPLAKHYCFSRVIQYYFVPNGRWKVMLDAASCYLAVVYYLHFVSSSEKTFLLFETPHIDQIYCMAMMSKKIGISLFRRNLEKMQY